MARTKQTARKSTGGKAPHKTVAASPFSNVTNTYNAPFSSAPVQAAPCSPNRAAVESFNPFSQVASPAKSLSAFQHEEPTTATTFQFATSVADFLNPGQELAPVEEPVYSSYQQSASTYTTSYVSHVDVPVNSYQNVSSESNDFTSYPIQLPDRGSINMGNFFTTAAGRAFRTSTRPQNPMSDLMLHIYKFRKEGKLTSEEHGALKDEILRGELQDVLAAFRSTNNRDQLLADLKRYCGSASSSFHSAPSYSGPVLSAVPTSVAVSHAPRDASPSAAKSSASKMLLLVAKLANMNKLSASEKSALKDMMVAGKARNTWESALRSFESTKDYDSLANQLKQLCNGSETPASFGSTSLFSQPAASPSKKLTSDILIVVAKLFTMGKINANERSLLKDKIVKGDISALEAPMREFPNDYDNLALAFKRVIGTAPSSFSIAPSSFGSFGSSFSTTTSSSSQKSEWLDQGYSHVWKNIGENNAVLFLDSPVSSSLKIACFDLDDTLVKTSSGKKFASAANDYVLLFPEVREKLRQLVNDGYKLVIFSNQLGVGKGNMPAQYVTGRISLLIKEVGVPIQAFCALQDDLYRKPSTKMWDLLIQHNGPVDLDQSFYVGDAAGRPADGIHPKDFSCSDRKFASNVGIKFYTPEEYFLGEAPRPFSWDTADLSTATQATVAFEGGLPLISDKQELVIFVGFPASGKSTFAKKHFVPAGYVHVNRDTLKTQIKCQQVTKEGLASGKSVVVDNTNPSSSARREYLDLAKAYGVPVRCFHFMTEEEFSQHLNMYREKKEGVHHVPKIAYAMFKKQFEPPRKEEGFVEIKQISFVPDFENEADKRMFYQHT